MKKYLLDIFVLLLLGGLLFFGNKNQFQKQDLREYQCYALAFWQGNHDLGKFPFFCKFYLQQTIVYPPLHYLPNEYPLLTILPFSIGPFNLSSEINYDTSFSLAMILFAGILYIILRKYCSQSTAIYYAITLIIAGWSTAATRYDLIPAGITLIAILLAQRKKWVTALIVLAIAGCLKLYPFLLFPVFVVALLQDKNAKKITPIVAFILTTALLISLSFLLNPEKTPSPLTYLKARPFQIESTWATLLWYLQAIGGNERIIFTYGSLNIIGKYAPLFLYISPFATFLGLIATYTQQIRHKLSLTSASILAILIAMITAKVLSPQYLLWIIPLIPLVKQRTKEIRILWLIVCCLTMLIFPFAYNNENNFLFWTHDNLLQLAIAIRNILLVYFVARLFITQQHLRKRT